jgi:ribosomal protein S18 acetylase RimI-like enzyme
MTLIRQAISSDAKSIVDIFNAAYLAVAPELVPTSEAIAVHFIVGSTDPSPAWLFSESEESAPFAVGNLNPSLNASQFNLDIRIRPESTRHFEVLSWFINAARQQNRDFKLRIICNNKDAGMLKVLQMAGFEPIRYFHNLRASVTSNLEKPVLSAGVTIRNIDISSVFDLRNWYEAHRDSFANHFGFVPREFEPWLKLIQSDESIPKDGVYFLEVNGNPGGFIELSDLDAQNSRGWVSVIGVHTEQQGKGYGQLLLRHALFHFSRRGYNFADLGVDTQNESGALRVYEKIGFKNFTTWGQYENPNWA